MPQFQKLFQPVCPIERKGICCHNLKIPHSHQAGIQGVGKRRRVRETSPALSSSSDEQPLQEPLGQSSQEARDESHRPAEVSNRKTEESELSFKPSTSTAELVPMGIVLACRPEKRERYSCRRGIEGRQDNWLAKPFARWYICEGVSHVAQAWARNVKELKDQAEEQQRHRDEINSDCEEVDYPLLNDGSRWISPRTVDPCHSSKKYKSFVA